MTEAAPRSRSPGSPGQLELRLTINPRTAVRTLVAIVTTFAVLGTAVEFMRLVVHNELALHAARRLFDLDGEMNLPTWYSGVGLLLAALLLSVVAQARRRVGDPYVRHWWGLAALFLYLSADEIAGLHEMTLRPLRWIGSTHGLFYITYVIPGLLVAGGIGFAYLRFLLHLPFATRWRVVVAGAGYVLSAVGMEMLEGRFEELYGPDAWSPLMGTLIVVEEIGEMAAIVLFIHALLGYLAATRSEASVASGALPG